MRVEQPQSISVFRKPRNNGLFISTNVLLSNFRQKLASVAPKTKMVTRIYVESKAETYLESVITEWSYN